MPGDARLLPGAPLPFSLGVRLPGSLRGCLDVSWCITTFPRQSIAWQSQSSHGLPLQNGKYLTNSPIPFPFGDPSTWGGRGAPGCSSIQGLSTDVTHLKETCSGLSRMFKEKPIPGFFPISSPCASIVVLTPTSFWAHGGQQRNVIRKPNFSRVVLLPAFSPGSWALLFQELQVLQLLWGPVVSRKDKTQTRWSHLQINSFGQQRELQEHGSLRSCLRFPQQTFEHGPGAT